ncbi:hypothetical protein AALO_G00165960 [Alosa alosa]|uniref:Coiled-coil domain-containing protein 62 n=1 Tax=Alosa alosa TaxID=278164 RepID=A0AAV6GBZ6_9TELE|nr:hypothetical protein AALO_G00165960 [Alosa alosa]
MNQERRCMKQADSSRRSSLQSSDFPAEPWHSTPVKKHQDARPDAVASGRDRMVKQENGPFQRRLPLSTSLPLTQDCQTAVCDLEYSTLQRQRRELQLLMAELKDRDQELNNMAATHHTQLLAWQQDRQRVLLLEERCARLEEELKQQHEVLRAVGRRVQTAEAQEKSSQRELSAAQQQLQDLQHTQRHSSQLQQELEDRNHALNSTITLLSSQVGQLQAREEELSAMLKLKDKDVTEAIAHIQDLSSRLRMQEDSQRELRTRESKIFAELEEVKRLYREVRHENTRLKDELEEKTLENSTQREEVIRLKQETQLLRRDLLISGEGESWKDEMLELSRSKQERTEVELRCLRQVCANQQNDLQLLKLNLESTQETLKVQRSHGSGIGYAAVESSFQRSGTEAGPTYYQHRAIEPPEELRRGGRTPMLERERQDAIHQPADSSGSSQTPLNGDSVVWLQAGVSTSEPRGGSSTAEPSIANSSWSQPEITISTCQQPVATISIAKSTATTSTSHPAATTSTSQHMATIPVVQAQPIDTMSTGQLIGEALSGVTSSSGPPCPPEAQPSCSSTSARPPAIVNEQSPASRHSEVTEVSGDVYSVAQEELPRDTPVVCGGAEEQQKDEPGVGVATDRYEEQRGKPEMEEEEEKKVEEQDMKRETSGEEEEKVKKMKEGVERGTLWEEEEEGLEVEVAVMLDVDSESEYSVQMVEVDPLTLDLNLNPETDQVCRVCQGEATCSPQPASPVLWTSVNPGGSPRAIYLSSPTTPKQGFQEAECTSTHRLQRLLEESRQMVATLEGLSLEPKSPSPRPAHAHTPSPSHHPSHSPSPNHASAGNLNGCYDYSSSQHSSSEVHSQNSSGHSSTLIRKIHHLTKNSPSKPGGDTSQ